MLAKSTLAFVLAAMGALSLVGCGEGSNSKQTDAEMRKQMERKPESEMTPAEKDELQKQRAANLEMARKMAGKDN